MYDLKLSSYLDNIHFHVHQVPNVKKTVFSLQVNSLKTKVTQLYVQEGVGEKFVEIDLETLKKQQLCVDNLDSVLKVDSFMIILILKLITYKCTVDVVVPYIELYRPPPYHYGLPVVMWDVHCTSRETQLHQCNYSIQHSPYCYRPFGIQCQTSTESETKILIVMMLHVCTTISNEYCIQISLVLL